MRDGPIVDFRPDVADAEVKRSRAGETEGTLIKSEEKAGGQFFRTQAASRGRRLRGVVCGEFILQRRSLGVSR